MVVEIPVTQARADFAELVSRVGYGGETVIITRHGKPLVALVPAREVDSRADSRSGENVTVLDVTSSGRPDAAPYQVAAKRSPEPRARK